MIQHHQGAVTMVHDLFATDGAAQDDLIFKIASTPAFSLIPLLVRDHFGGDAAQLSLLEALFGVGVIAGGLILSVWGGFKRKIHTILAGIVIFSIAFLAWGLLPLRLPKNGH